MRRLLGVSVLLLLPLTACSGGGGDGDGPPSAQDVATALAKGLAADDVSAVPFAGVAPAGTTYQEAYVAALGDLVDLDPTVTVDDVTATTDTSTEATATLVWAWPVGDESATWTYDTTVPLARTGEEWAVTWSPTVVEPDLADDEVLDLRAVEGERGDVLGSGGTVLVTERPVVQVGIDKAQTTPGVARRSARGLARLVDVDATSFVKQVKAAGAQGFVPAITYRQDEVPGPVTAGLSALVGARSIAGRQPLGPTRDFASPVLGRVGPVTAEMVEKDPGSYQAGDVAGLSGLQARYDAQLRGTPGQLVVAEPAAGGVPRELFRSEPVPGRALTLTLDERLQTAAENALAGVGPASALVALRPSTGDLLVVANGPGNGGQNLATFGQYAPGSTFKIVSSLALLRAGLTPDSTAPCTPTITVDGKSFKNYSDYPAGGIGDIPLRTALANSCNTAFISQAGKVGTDSLGPAANALGLGIDHDLGFPAYFGQVAQPPASETEAAADLIGQGTVLASPMTMAAVIGSVQQGSTVVPRLVADPAPTPASGAPTPAVPLTAAEADTLRTMLRGVVTDGSGAALADVPGAPVIAKTGTAEFGTGADPETHAWMVAAQGDLAVAVFVDLGDSGSGTAGPVLEAFLRAAAVSR